MENLNTYTLEELSIGKGRYGIPAPAIPFNSSKYTYLRITDINDDGSLNKENLMSVDAKNIDNFVLRKNDIVFARTGNSTGRSYFYDGSDGKLVYAGFLVKFSIDEKKVNPRILKYYTHSKRYFDWIHSFDTGGTRGNINAKTYGKMPITLPPRWIQNKIVNILKSLDDKIELNNKINRNLEAQAQAIFKSWFVDFEPFKNGKFIDSELGKIPEYWQVVKFSEFLKPRIEKINNSTITEYSVTNSGIFKRDEKFKKRLSGAKTFNKIIYYADMVFGMSREILNWGLMRDQIGSVSSAYTVFSVNTELVDLSYLEFFMRYHHEYFKSIIRLASREGQGIDKAVLFNKCVIIPDTNAIARFLEILNSISNSRLAINEESRRLVQLRDALLPKLMSGEIDVANVAV